MNFIKNLQRRNVFKAAISYFLIGWVILQVAAILFPAFELPDAAMKYLIYFLVLVFPVWLIFAYIYEWTPSGFKKTNSITEEESVHKSTGKRFNKLIILGLSLVVCLLILDRIFNLSSKIMEPSAKINTIAILPFSNESANADNEFFASGIHSDISIKLAGVKDFRIVSRSSTMQYKDFKDDLTQLGERLNARYILEGSVRRANDQVRITVQLVDSENKLVIWSDQYDEKLKNVFELQSKIATQISNKLQANLSEVETENLDRTPTTVLSAYDDFLKANFILDQPRPIYDDLVKAVKLLENAVDADPKFSQAWTKLAQANSEIYNILKRAGDREDELVMVQMNAESALEKAKQLSPEGWQVLQQEATYLLNIKEDRIEAMRLFEKAIEHNPSDVYSLFQVWRLYSYFGSDMSKSISLLEQAFELSQTSGPYGFYLSFAYEMAGDYGKLIHHLNRLNKLYPDDITYPVEIAYFQFLLDGKRSSFEAFERILKDSDASRPWDERALKNKEMVVSMFNNEFEVYHEKWTGKFEGHQRDHGGQVCPMVANDYANHARLLMAYGQKNEAFEILNKMKGIVEMPVNLNSVCQFNSQTYLPKLDFLSGDVIGAKEKLDKAVLEAIQNESIPIGAVEKTVVLEAADLIAPESIYYYYELLTKQHQSFASFETICANPWTFPNLIKDPQFVKEVKTDGRFVEFLSYFGFL